MFRNRSARIVTTLGPATHTPDILEKLVMAGADVVCLNFSHGSHDDHRQNFEMVRAIEKKIGHPIGILMDLQGPKLRVGSFLNGRITLQTGSTFTLDMNPDLGDETRVQLPHPEIFQAVTKGTDLLLDDGKLRLKVEKVTPYSIETVVVVEGTLSDKKGLNVPNVLLPISAITNKDADDLAFGLELGVDWVGLSFVQRPEDVTEGQALIGGRAGIISKLEKPSAIDHLDEIIRLSDAIMVARGDLGVELPPERVPMIQKRILRACHQAGKPVVVATQMLESMISSPTPTRAEASDVATAIYDGADAVMLSAESAVGKYPLEAVAFMDRIIGQVEADDTFRRQNENRQEIPENSPSDAIAAASRQVAETIGAEVIVAYTSSGSTAIRVSRQRPNVPILCLSVNRNIARRLMLVWGVDAYILEREITSFSEMVDQACRIVLEGKFARQNQHIVITAGSPFGRSGTTNTLRIARVLSEEDKKKRDA